MPLSSRHAAVVLAAVLVSAGAVPLAEGQWIAGEVRINLYETGLARVTYRVSAPLNFSVSLPLVGVPEESYGVLVLDENGEPLAYEIDEAEMSITVALLNSSEAIITYYTNSITAKLGNEWTVNCSPPLQATLVLPANASLLYVNPLPSEVRVEGDRLVLTFKPGPLLVKYMYIYRVPEGGGGAPGGGGEGGTQSAWLQQAMLMLAAVLFLAVISFALLYIRRRGAPGEAEEEREIIEALRKMGGGAFQSELRDYLGLPNTSLWRKLRNLERKGLVKIEKRAGRNYVRLA